MTRPFAYPPGFEWLVVLAHSRPGALIWLPLREARTGELNFAFVLREESDIIENLPTTKTKGVILEWRFGVFKLPIPGDEDRSIAFVEVMIRTPGGIAEANVNVLHLDDEMIEILDDGKPLLLAFVGDSGTVERQLLFPESEKLDRVVKKALEIFRQDPWTDPEYDRVKAMFEKKFPLERVWDMLGRK